MTENLHRHQCKLITKKEFLTCFVRCLAMTGPTMPGIVANVLVIDKRMPAYLQTQEQFYCKFKFVFLKAGIPDYMYSKKPL